MESRFSYAAVGAFVVGLGVAVVLAVLWLSAGGQWKHRVTRYESLSNESVAGLNVNAPVKLRGVTVGKVKAISINPDNAEQVRIIYEIQSDTPIKTDTVATIASQGLTGIAYVELSGGSRNAPPLEPGPDGAPPLIPTRPSLATRIESVLTRLMTSVDKTSSRVDGFFSDDNRAALASTLHDLSTLTHTLAAREQVIDAALVDAGRTLHQTAEATAHLDDTLARVGRGADAVNAAAEKVSRMGDRADTTLTAAGNDVHRFTTEALPQVENTMNELNTLADSLRRLSDQTADQPASLLRGTGTVRKGPGE